MGLGSSWWTSSAFVFVATGVVNVCNFAYHLVMVRALPPEGYATLMALLALSMIVSVPATTLQAVIARQVAYTKAGGDTDAVWRAFGTLVTRATVAGAVVFGAAVVGRRALAAFLQIQTPGLIMAWGIVVAVLLIIPVYIGVLQGLQEFSMLGVNLMVGGLARVACGVLLVRLGYGTAGAVGGLALAATTTWIVAWGQLQVIHRQVMRRERQERQGSLAEIYVGFEEWFSDLWVAIRPPWAMSRSVVAIAVAVTAYTSLTNSDVALAKHYLAPTDAGQYAVAAMISRIVLFLPAAVSIVLFPKVAHATAQGENARPLLQRTLLMTLGLSGAAAAVCAVWPARVARLMAGGGTAASAALVPWLAVAMVGMAMTNMALVYSLAADQRRHVAVFVLGAVSQVAGIVSWHATPWHIAVVEVVVAGALAGYAGWLGWGPLKW